jgi:FKBP-type peptidyl-prolyl cis-trans isomerase FkpA
MKIKNNLTIFLFLTAILVISLWSCDPSKKLEKEENAKIQEYLSSNSNLNFIKKPSGLYYLEVLAGTGLPVATHDTAYIKYTGKFLNGTVFETNTESTDTLIRPVNEGWLISGLDEGLTYMREGGKSMLLIPSKLAYGPSGYYFIDGWTPLIFDIEIVRIKSGPGK